MTATMAYGFTRAVTYSYNGSSVYFNEKTGRSEQKEMLLTDKVGRVTKHTFAAMIVWPVMLSMDLARVECFVRGKDPAEYRDLN